MKSVYPEYNSMSHQGDIAMAVKVQKFKVENIGCDGCVTTIKRALDNMPGIKGFSGSTNDKMITVQYEEPATEDAIVETLSEIDYPPVPVNS
jgi:copper chaperone CopZ